MVTHTDKSMAFEPTWQEWKNRAALANLDDVDTDVFRVGWPAPTIYREHEVIHLLCGLLDKALAERA